MFYLRKIDKKTEREENELIGDFYAVTKDRESLDCLIKSKFDWMGDEYKHKVYAIVEGMANKFYPLFEDNDNFIMTESGKTFARL